MSVAAPGREGPLEQPRWVRGVLVTEYFPVPEAWFSGRRVTAPGLRGKHRVDWLYSAAGVSMEGDGVADDGRRYHIAATGSQGWVNVRGRATAPKRHSGWSHGRPFWRAVGWRNGRGEVTYPLERGWSNGAPARHIAPEGIRFADGPSRPLVPWQSLAVDPGLIPLGSSVFLRAYCSTPARGWFYAADTGGAIRGRHIDVYRTAPEAPGSGNVTRTEAIFVIPAGARAPASVPSCSRAAP